MILCNLIACFISISNASSRELTDRIVVKFNYKYLQTAVVDNQEIKEIRLSQLLTSEGKVELKGALNAIPEIASLKATKLFPKYTTKDSLSVTRTGEVISMPPFWSIFLLDVPNESQYFKLIHALNSLTKLVDYAHPDYEVILQSAPNDSLYNNQYSLNGILPNAHINVEEAWDIVHSKGEPFIKVAVHDNGIDSLHPDLDVIFGGGYNNSNFPEDEWGFGGGHGTPVAGIIGAKRDNVTGIAGIAGGDGSDSTGVSLIDIHYGFGTGISAAYFMAGVVDAARSVGSYWDYPDNINNSISEYFNSAPGFGVHIGNHSYVIKTVPTAQVGKGKIPGPDTQAEEVPDCEVCLEAFLFSYRNGVINVVARGNRGINPPQEGPTYIEDLFPQSLPDSWIISVGASGYDGVTVQQGLNQSPQEVLTNFYSLYGGNMDIIAPGSDSIVYSTWYAPNSSDKYTKFNGTSSAAPHVSGVAALILSHYNKACYNRRNLAIEDVEYVLENSATDLYSSGYDDTTGWGRLNAGEALKMIENASKQIIHPDSLLSSQIIERDTIALYYHQRLYDLDWGPISSPWPLERERHYQVERIKVENTYTFADYMLPTTQILDYWVRPSGSNALEFYHDTFTVMMGNPQVLDTFLVFDTVSLNPHVQLTDFDLLNFTFTTTGYFYHFINKYSPIVVSPTPDLLFVEQQENYWYPSNIDSAQAKLPLSIYISDSTLLSIYDFPCDADNPLYDEDYQYLGQEVLEKDAIKVYPNPFDETLTVYFYSLEGLKEMTIKDLQGKICSIYSTINNSHIIDTRGLSSGIYLLNCHTERESFTLKLIKP